MDGFAVRASDTLGASASAPAYLKLGGDVPTGTAPAVAVETGIAVRIHTGAMMPAGADAVVMVEDTHEAGTLEIEILAAAAPGENVLQIGEDVLAGAVAAPAGLRLRPADLGALAALGITRVAVRARPRVAILSTGDEVVPAGSVPGLAQVRDVNAATLRAVVERAGGEAVACGIVGDDEIALERALRDARDRADLVVVSAGSSVSVRDLTARVVDRIGRPGVLVHGIAIKPGKPTVLALCDGIPVVGLPGNPASALVVAWRIVRPLIRMLGGEAVDDDGLGDERECWATLAAPVPSRPGREEYVPCTLRRGDGDERIAVPLFGASNLIFTLARADGLIAIPLDRAGHHAGDRVRIVVP